MGFDQCERLIGLVYVSDAVNISSAMHPACIVRLRRGRSRVQHVSADGCCLWHGVVGDPPDASEETEGDPLCASIYIAAYAPITHGDHTTVNCQARAPAVSLISRRRHGFQELMYGSASSVILLAESLHVSLNLTWMPLLVLFRLRSSCPPTKLCRFRS